MESTDRALRWWCSSNIVHAEWLSATYSNFVMIHSNAESQSLTSPYLGQVYSSDLVWDPSSFIDHFWSHPTGSFGPHPVASQYMAWMPVRMYLVSLGMLWPSKIMWSSHDNHAIMHNPCTSSVGHLADLGPEGHNPLYFQSISILLMLILLWCSTVLICIHVLDPDSEADCMCPHALFTSPSPSPPCGQPP